MAKNKKLKSLFLCCQSFSSIAFLCVIILLSGCDSQYIPNIPSLTGDSPKEEMADAKSHMEPKKIIPSTPRERLNPKNMFGKSLRSTEDRLDRLERAVQDMRNEFNNVKPSIKRLMAIEGDIQNLIGELQALSGQTVTASRDNKNTKSGTIPQIANPEPLPPQPVQVQPVKPVTPKAVKAAPVIIDEPTHLPIKTVNKPQVINRPAPSADTDGVYNVRIGEHPGKTRIVLDVGSKKSFKTDIDNNEKIMIVELPNTDWTTAKAKNFSKSPFISSYKVEETGDGHMIILQLKRDAKISYQAEIGSVSGKGRRIVIDVAGS